MLKIWDIRSRNDTSSCVLLSRLAFSFSLSQHSHTDERAYNGDRWNTQTCIIALSTHPGEQIWILKAHCCTKPSLSEAHCCTMLLNVVMPCNMQRSGANARLHPRQMCLYEPSSSDYRQHFRNLVGKIHKIEKWEEAPLFHRRALN